MNERNLTSPVQRRSFIAKLWSGVAVASAAVAASSSARGQSTGSGVWQAARHERDDWLDQLAGQHRFLFDAPEADRFEWALRFSNNFYRASSEGYGLSDRDSAVVIVARHSSTPFAYNDTLWSKYGRTFADRVGMEVEQAPERNPHNLPGDGATLPNLISRGVHFAVCQLSSRGLSRAIASETGAEAAAVYEEIAANLVENAHMVPAGILAVNRAQERGYAFVNA
jgi:intracellular sulfur oxidation DsrE/DsrF family protein